MCRALVLLLLLPFYQVIHCQYSSNVALPAFDAYSPKSRSSFGSTVIGFFGVSAGLNYSGIAGLAGEIPLSSRLALHGVLGVGTWGMKFMADMRFYRENLHGVYYSLGYSYATGLSKYPVPVEATGVLGPDTLRVDLYPVHNLNIGCGYAWYLGYLLRLHVEVGYAFDLTGPDFFHVRHGAPSRLTDGAKESLSFLKPGGFRIGAGVMIKL